MCGITGIVLLYEKADLGVVARMAGAQKHRGPDDEGYLLADYHTGSYVAAGGADSVAELGLPDISLVQTSGYNLAFGHRRLAIIDLTPRGHCPMSYADGRFWITYNGEIYNYLELRDELERLGHQFKTATDTEVALAAYAEWGEACLERFNGMFAFALWDVERRLVFCARDRLGIKPFHYAWDGRRLLFASEIKALLAHDSVTAAVDDSVVYDYLALGSLNHLQQTFFADVKTLPAAHFMTVDLQNQELMIRPWWELRPSSQSGLYPDKRSSLARFNELLLDSIRLRLRSDVAVGTCLSGGLDSSSIVMQLNALIRQESAASSRSVGDRQKTFSACYDDVRVDEQRFINEVVDAAGVESHKVFPLGNDGLWPELDRLVWHQEEPFGSTSVYAHWSVMRLARENGVTVLLDGQGGDELLAGYHPYFGPYLASLLKRGRLRALLAEASSASANTTWPKSFYLLLAGYNALPEMVQMWAMETAVSRRRTQTTVTEGMLRPGFRSQHQERRRHYSKHQGHGNLTSRLLTDTLTHSLPALLRYEDRNSMAFSREARVPFLDHRLVEYCFSLPDNYKIRDGWTKWILRAAGTDGLPEEVRWRKDKLGFATPHDTWLAEGAARIKGLFSSAEVLSAKYLSADVVKRLQQFDATAIGRVPGLWRMVNLEVWLRKFSDGYGRNE